MNLIWALTLSLLVLSLPVMGKNDITITQTNKKIVLEAPACGILFEQADAIMEWSQIMDQKLVCDCKGLFKRKCRIEVAAILPRLVNEKHGVCPRESGPNCWNASLVGSKILPSLRYSTREEMKFWMESPLCKERGPDEKIQPGDVVAIREAGGSEYHGFIYLTKELSFSKNGYYNGNPYALQSTDGVFDMYNVDVKCRRVYQRPKTNECATYVNYFKCDSMEEYLKKNPLSPDLAELNSKMNELECRVSNFVLEGKDSEIEQLVGDNLDILQAAVTEQLQNNALSVQDRLIWISLWHKAESNKEQLEIVK